MRRFLLYYVVIILVTGYLFLWRGIIYSYKIINPIQSGNYVIGSCLIGIFILFMLREIKQTLLELSKEKK
jgi:RsiW-degrading membrane proteinase PrsW (M82 family)